MLFNFSRKVFGVTCPIVRVACKSGASFASMLRTVMILVLGVTSIEARATETPNILFILTDDVGWGDIKAYNPDSKVSLPAIEQLASEGFRFTDAHTSAAKCAPSRYSVITGNYQWRGLKEWGQWSATGGSQILSDQQTLGGMLQQVGYKSAFIGKHHLGAEYYRNNSDEFTNAESLIDFSRAVEDGPLQRGFDYSFVAMRGIQDSPYAFFENDLMVGSPSNLITWTEGDYGDTEIVNSGIGLSDWVTRDVGPTLLTKAISFIDSHHKENIDQATNTPFFLYFNSEAVHSPRKPPVSLGGRRILGESGIGLRTDMLIEVDVMVEQLLGAIADRGLSDNTLVIFTSDNGAQRRSEERRAGHFANGILRGDKGTIYEGGHRVPLIIKRGSRVLPDSTLNAGSELDALVGVQDLYATLADMVGAPIVNGDARDSFSILPLLTGEVESPVRDHMISEADAAENGSGSSGLTGQHKSYRSGRYKLIFNSSDRPVELYDLSVDLTESNNLINDANQRDNRTALINAYEKALQSARTAPVRVAVANQAPQITVISPSTGLSIAQGSNVNFAGSASDPEDGDIGAAITWISSIDGALGVGAGISATLSVGQHQITASVTDTEGKSASGSLVVTVVANSLPVVQLISPASGVSFSQGDMIIFEASATDAEDGSLSNVIDWRSNRGGDLGIGETISINDLSEGAHAITASVTDSFGGSASATINIEVTQVASPPPPPPPPAPPAVPPTPTASSSGGGSLGFPVLLTLFVVCVYRRKRI